MNISDQALIDSNGNNPYGVTIHHLDDEPICVSIEDKDGLVYIDIKNIADLIDLLVEVDTEISGCKQYVTQEDIELLSGFTFDE